MIYQVLFSIALLVGALAFLHREMNRMFAEEKARSRSPFKEKLLRPAGESLRLKVEEIRDQIMETGFVMGVLVVAPCFIVLLTVGLDWRLSLALGGLFFVGCYRAAFLKWKKVKDLRKELRNYRLGFDGERYVAEKLGVLTGLGYRVFHDFVFDMKPGGDATNFNFDHIVIGTNGIFLMETKAIRQPNGEMPDWQESHKVFASGDVLKFPTGITQRKQIAQTKRNAGDLSKWLTGTSATPVSVEPLLILPGWFVDDDRTGRVRVLNGTKIEKVLPALGTPNRWTVEEVRAFADRLEAHCRNVEGA